MKRNLIICVSLFVVSILIALISTYYRTDQTSISAEAKKIEKKLKNVENAFEQFAANDALIHSIITKDYSSKDLESFSNYRFDFFIYLSDTLTFWSNNATIPLYNISRYDEGSNFVRLRNGWFELIKTTRENRTICGLIKIQSGYGFENAYLKNELSPIFNIHDRLDISKTTTDGSSIVKNKDGKPLFALSKTTRSISTIGFAEQLFYWLSLIALCLCFHMIAKMVAVRQNPFIALMVLVLSFIGIRLLLHFVDIPFTYSSIDLFNPSIYASGIFTKSMGDMLINISFLLWVVYFWYEYVRSHMSFDSRNSRVGVYIVIALFLIAIQQIIKSFVIDSNIPFELDNFLELSIFSVIGLLLIALIILAFWILSYGLIRLIPKERVRMPDMALMIPAILILVIYQLLYPINFSGVFTLIWFVVFIILLHNYFRRINSFKTFSGIILVIFLFSCWAAITLEYYNYKKELGDRKLFAIELSEERDLMTESLVKDISPRVKEDEFIKGFFTNPYVSKKDINERIAYLYLSGISKKYDFTIYTFDNDGKPFKSISDYELSYFEDRINKDCDTIIDKNLYFIPEKSGKYAYYVEFPLDISSKLHPTLLIELTPKIFTASNVYPELLLEERFRNPDSRKYLYALYAYGNLIGQKGDFPYDFFLNEETRQIEDEFKNINRQQHSHLVYSPGKSKTIIVSLERERWLKPLSVFSYIFCFFLLMSLILSGLVLFRNYSRDKHSSDYFGLSFRNRITISMILIIILSFLIIGVVTARYFTNEYELYHKQRLIRKEKAVLSALEYLIKGNKELNINNSNDNVIKRELSLNIASLSDIHSMDINIFNVRGDLLLSSKPEIFSKGLVSDKMNPLAYYQLASVLRNQFLHEEKIGLLKYLSVYVPIRNENGETIAFLNLPYFAQSSNLKEEISNFMVALVNVYVFLLVCAGFIAFFISNSITRPLTEISEKLRLLNLTRSNEPIEWKRKDEIGELVSEYNKMIRELEKSVQLLAKSERETAWREMAKQIAHEIKNPLTPMKLSIQYLQRSMESNSADKDEMVERVSKTLIEQIDNLSEIATAFSSFAQMPRAKSEVLQLEGVAQSVFDLFKDHPGIEYRFHSKISDAKVLADKNQLISAFNNLLKNASQAISEDQEGLVEMKLYPNSNSYIIEVTDNGKGIEEQLKDKVFVPNFTTKSSGTGLGLAITKQVIENAHGEIWFESEENKGTSFYIKLLKFDDNSNK